MIGRKKVVARKLGEVLIERGLITHDQLDEALEIQKKEGGLLGEILVRLNHVNDESIACALAVQYAFPYLPISSYEIDDEVTGLVPKALADKYGLMPIDKIGNILTVAMSNPLDQDAIHELESLTHLSVRPFISTHPETREAIRKYYKQSSSS